MLLIIFTIGAIAGILVFAKTRVSPPSNLKLVDQYSANLKSTSSIFDSIKDFSECRREYLKLDDRINRFREENVIDDKTSDTYRKKIVNIYGTRLTDYGFAIFQKSVWPEAEITAMLKMVNDLKSERLSSGEVSVNKEFLASAEKINKIMADYNAALRLSKNSAFNGLSDASSKMSKARTYSSSEYLKNNAMLVSALNSLPSRLAQSHYNQIAGMVNSLGSYTNVSKDYYMNTLVNRADKAIQEYKNTNIYGANKPSMTPLENRAENFVIAAISYYGD